jgi:hypothetical protein
MQPESILVFSGLKRYDLVLAKCAAEGPGLCSKFAQVEMAFLH